MRSFFEKLGFTNTFAMILAVLGVVFVIAGSCAACPQQLNVGCAQQLYSAPLQVQSYAVQQFAVQPQVQYFQQAYVAPQPVIVQRQVQAYSQPVLVQRAYSAPIASVQVGYGAVAVRTQAVAVDVGRQRGRFALRPRLQRAANIGAASAVGVPVGAIRVVR